jgi:TPR repeat protein
MFARRDIRCLAVLAVLSLPAPSSVVAQEKGKKYAVIVGVNAYDHAALSPLEYAENDAEELGRLLRESRAGFAKIRVLTTARGKKNSEDAPTGKNIRAALAELYQRKTRRDVVLVALSGHGVQLEVRDPAGKGPDKTYPFFCPTDGQLNDTKYATGRSLTLINLDHLLTDLGECGGGAKLLLVDACRNKVRARNVDVAKVGLPGGVAALFSCKSGEYALESGKLGKGHGVFFYYVLEGLRGKAKNDDNEVTWGSLTEYVRRQVPRRVPLLAGGSATQTPQALENGLGSPPILIRGVSESEAEQLYRRGLNHLHGLTVPVDCQGAVRCFRQAARKEHDLACAMLAYCVFRGVGVDQDEEDARRWIQRGLAGVRSAAEDGRTDAENIMGRLLELGLGVEPNLKAAAAWYRKAADKGDEDAMNNLGWICTHGRGVEKDLQEAVRWYRQAIARGLPRAMSNLGLLYETGRGVKKDDGEAVRWYRKAADKGLPSAMTNLALMFMDGRGGKKDDAEAMRWFRKAADKDEPVAMNSLGWMFENGRGVEKDESKAVHWYRKAAARGSALAMRNLGGMYANGRGVEKEYSEAVRWYRKAADKGLSAAMTSLGGMLLLGHGVEKDRAAAIRWFRKAAELGDDDARKLLKELKVE